MAQMNNEGSMLMKELRSMFPEIDLLLDTRKVNPQYPAEDVEITLGQETADDYSLLQHAQDAVCGFLNPGFYEKMNSTDYKPTMRSLLRHAVNSVENTAATGLTAVNHPSDQELRRKLGLDDSLSPLEKTTVIGLVSVGVAFSLYRSRRGGGPSNGAVKQLQPSALVPALKNRHDLLGMWKRLF